MEFCKAFNAQTQEMEKGSPIPVVITYYQDKSFTFVMDGEEILSTFYNKITYKKSKDHWRIPFNVDRFRGLKAVGDLVDADTGEVVVEAGKKITARQARQLGEKGLKAIKATDEDLLGNYLAEDIVNYATGEIFLEAGDEIDEKTLKVLLGTGENEIKILDIDHVNVGAYIRNTLAVDKNESRQDALFDIYRVMRWRPRP